MDPSKMKIVYVINTRGNKSYWSRIGVAFVNKDGSINAKLEAVPVSGELQIRDYVPSRDDAGTGDDVSFTKGSNGSSDLLAELG